LNSNEGYRPIPLVKSGERRLRDLLVGSLTVTALARLTLQHAAKLFAPLVSVNRVFTLPVAELVVSGREDAASKVIVPLGTYDRCLRARDPYISAGTNKGRVQSFCKLAFCG
jgi:hypothetical protein